MTETFPSNVCNLPHAVPATKKAKKLCYQCKTTVFKYRCPKCYTLTCSLDCCNDHKQKLNCDGIRSWLPIKGISNFNEKISISDQQFIGGVKSYIKNTKSNNRKRLRDQFIKNTYLPNPIKNDEPKVIQDLMSINTQNSANIDMLVAEQEKEFDDEENSEHFKTDQSQMCELSHIDKCLIVNAQRRRIWWNFKDAKEAGGSRFERISKTIFWTITLKFAREIPTETSVVLQENTDSTKDVVKEEADVDNEIGDLKIYEEEKLPMEAAKDSQMRINVVFEYTVKNIPESLTVATLLRQFLKPKIHGCLVSADDIDMEKMTPFIEKELPNLILYMQAPLPEKEKYYILDANKSLLDNLRGRFINGHPTFLVTFNNEFDLLPIVNEEDVQQMHSYRQYNKYRFQNNNNFNNRDGGHHRHYNNNYRGGRGRWSKFSNRKQY